MLVTPLISTPFRVLAASLTSGRSSGTINACEGVYQTVLAGRTPIGGAGSPPRIQPENPGYQPVVRCASWAGGAAVHGVPVDASQAVTMAARWLGSAQPEVAAKTVSRLSRTRHSPFAAGRRDAAHVVRLGDTAS